MLLKKGLTLDFRFRGGSVKRDLPGAPGCTACDFLNKCSRLRCRLVTDGGLFYYPIGCLAKCPFGVGNVECQNTRIHPKWYPEDPCYKTLSMNAEGTYIAAEERKSFPWEAIGNSTAAYILFLVVLAIMLLSSVLSSAMAKCWKKINSCKKPVVNKIRSSLSVKLKAEPSVSRASQARKSRRLFEADPRVSVFTIEEVRAGNVGELDLDQPIDAEKKPEEEDKKNIFAFCFGKKQDRKKSQESMRTRRMSVADALKEQEEMFQKAFEMQETEGLARPEEGKKSKTSAEAGDELHEQAVEDAPEVKDAGKKNIFAFCFGKKKERNKSQETMGTQMMSPTDALKEQDEMFQKAFEMQETEGLAQQQEEEENEKKARKKSKDNKGGKNKMKKEDGEAENEPTQLQEQIVEDAPEANEAEDKTGKKKKKKGKK
ncbi:unnamed protein product [Schistocephalus solidus]|uniref:Uncharacterized protein n=1 Tax=Schistocephalus solidus TaxID=70667 RepID=A0A183SVZ4_SCHSO|nr:unnamed protein product [Schistocephalus solidus]